MIVARMATELALSTYFLRKVAKTASYRYMEYTIPKKTGGQRTIHHPARELKLVQTWLLENVLTNLRIHPAATAYIKELNIRRNAERHVANNYLLRVDFQDFFPSLKSSDVAEVLRASTNALTAAAFNSADINFVTQVVCRFAALTIGAPTSPHISNSIMYQFDLYWAQAAESLEVSYTRYADDLYFSTDRPNVLREILDKLREWLNGEAAPALIINEKKTVFTSRKRRRIAAGLVLTSDKKISIGRHKKRVLKSKVLKLQQQQLTPDEVVSLKGWIAYLRSVEPNFVLALQRKYKLDFDASQTWEH